MRKETIALACVVIAVVVVLICSGIAIRSASGVNPPFTVIESESMQHSDESEIGIIDTADMILVKSPSKTEITSYVEGYEEDYKTFGDYGNVIVYKRTGANPVIHRAILWLEFNGDNTWSASTLKEYNDASGKQLWDCTSGSDYNSLSGTLTLKLQSDYRDGTISINLDRLIQKSGYITMGDNNGNIDQNSSISSNYLVSEDRIKSVAWKEIPWIGALKLIANGNLDQVENKVPNTLPCLISFFITIVLIIISVGFIIDEYTLYKIKRRKN